MDSHKSSLRLVDQMINSSRRSIPVSQHILYYCSIMHSDSIFTRLIVCAIRASESASEIILVNILILVHYATPNIRIYIYVMPSDQRTQIGHVASTGVNVIGRIFCIEQSSKDGRIIKI